MRGEAHPVACSACHEGMQISSCAALAWQAHHLRDLFKAVWCLCLIDMGLQSLRHASEGARSS